MSDDFKNFLNNYSQKRDKMNTIHHAQIQQKRSSIPPRRIVEEEIDEQDDMLSESADMIKALKSKIDTVFYRFGMSGLEKLDEAMIGAIETLINPNKETERVSQRQIRRQAIRKTQSESIIQKPVVKKIEEKTDEMPANDILSIAAAGLRKLDSKKPAIVKQSEEQTVTENVQEQVQPAGNPTSSTVSNDDLAMLGAALSKGKK